MRRIKTLVLFAAALGACWAATMLSGAGSALAATPIPATLDVPNNGAESQIVYDPVSQVTFVAWTDPQNTTYGAIDLCVLASGTTGCEGGAPTLLTITPTDNTAVENSYILLSGLTVLPNGNVVVVGDIAYGGTIDWESGPTGSAFLTGSGTTGQGLQNNGAFSSSLGSVSGNIAPLSDTDFALLQGGDQYFGDSAYSGAETMVPSENVNPPATGDTSSTYTDGQQDADGPAIAAEAAPAPAAAGTDIVVAVGDNSYGPNAQLTDCTDGDTVGTGYGYDVGTPSGSSNASGTLNYVNPSTKATIPAYSALTCNATNPTVASPDGGTQGIGVLENEGNGLDNAGNTFTLDYRPFQATAMGGSFGSPVVVANLTGAASDDQVVDDSTDGVYALFSGGGFNGYSISYSSDGGAQWGPIVEIPNLPSYSSDPVITAVGGGNFELSFTDNPNDEGEQTYIDLLNYQALEIQPTALSTVQTSGSTSGADITIGTSTLGETDTAVLTGASASGATGTVTYSLYANSGCTGAVVATSTETVTGGVVPASSGVGFVLPAGTYYWQASYSGDAENAASTSTCGSAILTVAAATPLPVPVITPTPVGTGTLLGTATATATTVTLTISCSVVPCTATFTIETIEAVPAFATPDRRTVRREVKLAFATFRINRKGKRALLLHWNASGQKLVKKDHGRLKATVLLTVKTKGGTKKSIHTLRIIEHIVKRK
jgi:hypothetical protein